jgi:hypothetical protein
MKSQLLMTSSSLSSQDSLFLKVNCKMHRWSSQDIFTKKSEQEIVHCLYEIAEEEYQ